MVKEKKTSIPIRYSVLVRQESKQYASWCPELDVASCGDTVEEACNNLKEAVSCLIDSYVELGELEEFLNERGLSVKKDGCPRVFLSEEQIDVPAFK